MGLSSYFGGLKVTTTLGKKITRMDHTEGFAAKLTTAFLVASALCLGLPVSTTHESSGAIIGIGLRHGTSQVNWAVIRDMVLARVVTVLAAGALGLVTYVALLFVHRGP